jgi:hypothetical protein
MNEIETEVRAFFRRCIIKRPDEGLVVIFYELMSEEKQLNEWIRSRGMDFLMKILERAKQRAEEKAATPKPTKTPAANPSQQSLPISAGKGVN